MSLAGRPASALAGIIRGSFPRQGTLATDRKEVIRMTTHSCMVPDTLRGVRMSHSDDLVAVWHGYAEPALACGFHAKFYAQEVYTAHRELMRVTR